MNFTPTDKVSSGACQNNYDVYFATCKSSFCSFNDHICKSCFELCDHNCSDTEY